MSLEYSIMRTADESMNHMKMRKKLPRTLSSKSSNIKNHSSQTNPENFDI